MFERRPIAINMQDAALLAVKVDPLCFRPRKQMFTRSDRETGRFSGVFSVLRNARDKLGKPRQFVPARFRVDEQRSIPAKHPLQAFQHRAPMVPDLGIGGGDRKSTRLNSSHVRISYAVFCLKKKTRPPT